MFDHDALLAKFSGALETLEPEGRWSLKGPVGKGRKCDIYQVINDITATRLALKLYDQTHASAAAPHIQFRALQRCAKAPGATVRSPQPLAFLPEERAVLMTWHEAPMLLHVLWRNILTPQHRLELISQAGIWLRSFHDLSCISIEPFDGTKLLEKLEGRIENNPAMRMTLEENQECKTAFAAFSKLAVQARYDAPHALLHGDFTPSNLLVDDDGVVGIDMWGARHAPVYEDAARMLTYLAITSPFSLASMPLHKDGALMQAFAGGYGRDMLDMHSGAWSLTLLYQQLRRWLVYRQRSEQKPASPIFAWQLNRAQKLVGQSHSWLEHCYSKI